MFKQVFFSKYFEVNVSSTLKKSCHLSTGLNTIIENDYYVVTWINNIMELHNYYFVISK